MPSRFQLRAAALFVLIPCALTAQGQSRGALDRDLERLRTGEAIQDLPPVDSVAPGARTIAAGTTVKGTVVARGPVLVAGRVDGSVVSLAGDVTVRPGGWVTGHAIAVGGRVIADSGRVDGEMRSMATLPSALGALPLVADVRSPARRTMDAVTNVVGSFCILLIIAVGVVLFAGRNLDEVVAAIQTKFARAFWFGLLGQLVALPALLVLIVGLALSLIGILLIPFAIVAYAIAYAGLVTLGFIAVARLVGGAIWRGGESASRTRTFMAVAIGLAAFISLWVLGALTTWAPMAATVVRAAALAATWAAMTLGLGAALLSRAGTHRRIAGITRPVELAAWQTPTPVVGVVAARRPVASAREAR